MAACKTVVNEVLSFLTFNFNKLNDDNFIIKIIEFYKLEELNNAKEILAKDLECFKLDNFNFNNKNSFTKKEKVLEIRDLLQFMFNNKLDNQLIYAATNLSRLPFILFDNICNIIDKKLDEFKENMNNKFINLSTTMHKNATSNFMNKSTLSKPNLLWSERTKSADENLSECEMPYTLVHHRKKRTRPSDSPENKTVDNLTNNLPETNNNTSSTTLVNKTNVNEIKLTYNKIIGVKTNPKTSTGSKLKSINLPIKKHYIYITDIENCYKEDVVDHLAIYDIIPLSCAPIFKAKNSDANIKYNDTTPSSTFRICINKLDLNKIRNPEIWPMGATLRDWIFNDRLKLSVIQTVEDSITKNNG